MQVKNEIYFYIFRDNAGEIISCTSGEWHPGCFTENPSPTELKQICMDLGFRKGAAMKLPTPSTANNMTSSRPVIDPFNVVWINKNVGNKLRLGMRTGNEPYVSFQPGSDCYRLFIECL